VQAGTPLKDLLFPYGVEFPCGGKGRCRGCRVRVLDGAIEPKPEEAAILTPAEIREGWRLACRATADQDCVLEIAQFEAAILADHSRFRFKARSGQGVAIDLGTTTIVAQLLDLPSAKVLAVRAGLNPQAAFGADIMSRVQFALQGGDLTTPIRRRLAQMIDELEPAGAPDVVVVGNTVMHHLCCGLDVTPLSHYPFETPYLDAARVDLGNGVAALFLPNLGSFVGSDILAGILATGLHESDEPCALIDLGTNGEIVVGNRRRMVCASTAAGPAFEGGRISMGMRAQTGAIAEVSTNGHAFRCSVIGGGAARGICGSGLVDAVAAALDLGLIHPSGRLVDGVISLVDGVCINQADVRELQLAKGAIAAGIGILVRRWGIRIEEISRVYLAGAFGNYINRTSARRIGLLPFPEEKVEAAGNTALRGAKIALFEESRDFSELRARIEHIPLGSDPEFQENFVASLAFPVGDGG